MHTTPFAGTCTHLCSWISVQFSTATSACFTAEELQAVNSQWLVVRGYTAILHGIPGFSKGSLNLNLVTVANFCFILVI